VGQGARRTAVIGERLLQNPRIQSEHTGAAPPRGGRAAPGADAPARLHRLRRSRRLRQCGQASRTGGSARASRVRPREERSRTSSGRTAPRSEVDGPPRRHRRANVVAARAVWPPRQVVRPLPTQVLPGTGPFDSQFCQPPRAPRAQRTTDGRRVSYVYLTHPLSPPSVTSVSSVVQGSSVVESNGTVPGLTEEWSAST
jgi:hypothetical protein